MPEPAQSSSLPASPARNAISKGPVPNAFFAEQTGGRDRQTAKLDEALLVRPRGDVLMAMKPDRLGRIGYAILLAIVDDLAQRRSAW